ncbi:2458_t:CDS:1, partial [Funneliformis geosporum]
MDKFLGRSGQSSETPKRKPNSATDGSKVNKKSKTAASPKDSWRNIHDWLEYRNIDEKVFMFCTWCEKAGYSNQFAKGCNTYKKDLIDRHVKNKEHNLLEKARKGNQPNIIQ